MAPVRLTNQLLWWICVAMLAFQSAVSSLSGNAGNDAATLSNEDSTRARDETSNAHQGDATTAAGQTSTSFSTVHITSLTTAPRDSSTPPTRDPRSITSVRAWMEQTFLLPLAAVGIVLNVVALWTWAADRNYNPTTFLFKYLAVCDTVALVCFICFVVRVDPLLREVGIPISNVAQRIGVHTTLMIAVVRWLAVYKPLHVRVWLSAGRIRLVCFVVFLWCLAMEGFYFYSSYAKADREFRWSMYYVGRVIGLALPLVLMMIVSLMIVFNLCKPREAVGGENRNLEGRYRLTTAMLCLALCSLISYPISIITETVTNLECYEGQNYVCDALIIYYIKFSTFLLQVLNLSINFGFYLAFAHHFRQLLAFRFGRCGLNCVSYRPDDRQNTVHSGRHGTEKSCSESSSTASSTAQIYAVSKSP